MVKQEIILPNDLSDLRYVQAKQLTDIEGESQKAKFWKKVKMHPLVPMGVIATTAILGTGFYYFMKRDSINQQKMMRGRIVAQFSTFFVFVAGSLYHEYKGKYIYGEHKVDEDAIDYSKYDKI